MQVQNGRAKLFAIIGTVATVLIVVISAMGTLMTIGSYRQQIQDLKLDTADYRQFKGQNEEKWEEIQRYMVSVDQRLKRLEERP